jgi:hypothetical protein
MRSVVAVIAVATLVAGCATVPSGPSVMVLPGNGKGFDQFQADDALCRQWAAQQTGLAPQQAAVGNTVGGAVVGTALGAALGAAIGAAAGSPGTGAAVGAGAGLLGGTAVGAGAGQSTGASLQRRYDMTYMQCMYAKGNQVPMARGSQPPYSAPAPPPPPPARDLPPPPPPGPPPPPPSSGR